MATDLEILAATLAVSSARALNESTVPWIEELSLQTPDNVSIHHRAADSPSPSSLK